MNGVEILNTIHEYAKLVQPYWFAMFAIMALITAILGACTVNHDVIQRMLISLEMTFLIGIIASFTGMLIKTDEIIDTKYQVVISDEVSMTDFYEHYEVIDQDGKIFTVREKTNEEY